MAYETEFPKERERCSICGAWLGNSTHKRTEKECEIIHGLNSIKIGDTVRELPDEAGECRFIGKIAGFANVDGQKLAIVRLEVGFYSNHTNQTPLYTSLLVVHPSNLVRL